MEYWSFGKRIIYVMIVICFTIDAHTVKANDVHIADERSEPSELFRVFVPDKGRVTFAQITTETTEESDRTTVENEKTSSESSGTATEGSSTRKQEAETRQVKPFKPSEEIAAEQAVAFPWDI